MNSPGTHGSAVDDARLLRRISRRDREAFSRFYDRYAFVLYATAMRVLNNADESSDVLQKVFVEVWDASSTYDGALGSPFNWVLTLTRRTAIDRLRAQRRRYAFFAEISGEKELDPGEIQSPPGNIFTAGQVAHARTALARIPYEQRQAIEMAFLGGMTQTEVAEELGQPPDIIAERIRRGMLKLRESLHGLP